MFVCLCVCLCVYICVCVCSIRINSHLVSYASYNGGDGRIDKVFALSSMAHI